MGKTIGKHYLFLTLFTTGAAVMILELIGTRVIAPIYGGGLFVWASLITVALTCLSIGYWIGGKIADKNPAFNTFYLIILIAGILVAPISLASKPVLRLSIDLGFRVGPLLSAYILFTLPLILLGMVSPYAIRLATAELNVLGATAGRLYAISTLGSFVGTLLTGFVLIPSFGTRKILFMQSVILILLWVGYYLLNRKYAAGLISIAFIAIPALLTFAHFSPSEELEGLKVIYETETFYGHIKVCETEDERMLYVDNIKQSAMHKYTNLPTTKFSYCFEMLPLFNKKGKNACLIGLAGGSVPRRLWEYGIKTDSVDIEPRMEYIAREYFGFLDYFGKIHITDGRLFINRSKEKYDFVIIDVFTGDDIPFHMLTKESFGEVRGLLNEGGVLGINFLGNIYGEDSLGWKSVHRTIREVFPHVKVYCFLKGSNLEDHVSNVIFFASDSELNVPEDIGSYCKNPVSRRVLELLVKSELEEDFEGAVVLTDDYSPIEFLRRDVARKIREKHILYNPKRYFQ